MFQKEFHRGNGGNSKGGAKHGKSVNAVDVQDKPEPEVEQSYLELAMVERADVPRAKARPSTLVDIPSDFKKWVYLRQYVDLHFNEM